VKLIEIPWLFDGIDATLRGLVSSSGEVHALTLTDDVSGMPYAMSGFDRREAECELRKSFKLLFPKPRTVAERDALAQALGHTSAEALRRTGS
jgi:hypothetical protein